MPTECSAKPMGRVGGRTVVADFEGGAITSNAGGLLLRATDRATGLVERFAARSPTAEVLEQRSADRPALRPMDGLPRTGGRGHNSVTLNQAIIVARCRSGRMSMTVRRSRSTTILP